MGLKTDFYGVEGVLDVFADHARYLAVVLALWPAWTENGGTYRAKEDILDRVEQGGPVSGPVCEILRLNGDGARLHDRYTPLPGARRHADVKEKEVSNLHARVVAVCLSMSVLPADPRAGGRCRGATGSASLRETGVGSLQDVP